MIPAPSALGSVLVVEDDPDLADCLSDLLTATGYRVAVLESAFGAAALIRRERPAAILLDLGLPFRSGLSLLAELKADPHTAAAPILILSAYHELLPEARRSHVAAVLAKPFDLAELFRVLARVVGAAPGAGSRPRPMIS
jgi:DNA-binding response OmpR family regulator